MTDLKAAAEEMREIADGSWAGRQSRDACKFAAQALKALAWMEESGWRLEAVKTSTYDPYDAEYCWCCTSKAFTRYRAATPLAAIIAAMEGENSDT